MFTPGPEALDLRTVVSHLITPCEIFAHVRDTILHKHNSRHQHQNATILGVLEQSSAKKRATFQHCIMAAVQTSVQNFDVLSSVNGTVKSESHQPEQGKSVFAETYDPENDDDDDGARAIFPKTDEQRSRLCDSVKNILLFRSLDKEQMNEVLDAIGIYKAYVGEDQKHIHTYEGRGSFGELALLYNMPRAATIQAETDGQLWAMDRQTFRRILLKSAFRKRKMYEALLDSVPMLKTLQNYERMNLADALIPRTFTQGERIIKQGDVADGMYFIEQGKVSIRIQQDAGEVEVSNLEKGGYFGELALVTHRPRAASAYAVDNVKVAFLDVDAFERLLGPCMNLMKRNIGDYESQLVKIFGSKNNISDIR
ncbi:cAMP-dependent protein kinase type II regulatory subunit [Culex quinquefasciatus]|uniref:cAMP-dependent protein kinase type II regulatory subunit n=1 Tax=Culex quinquefasciatus TaxID=7176 RepID=UPI0018E2E10A|nr:cAMP-dependent protein kinase type II regulatory subunit [Culex quinquefasciatus]